MTTRQINAWTDGASSGNPGPAGWAVLIDGELIADCVLYATNNEMELFAAYQAVANCPAYYELTIHTDSKLTIGLLGMGWHTVKPHLAALQAIVLEVAQLRGVALRFEKSKGHAFDENNNRVDRAAVTQARIAAGCVAGSSTRTTWATAASA